MKDQPNEAKIFKSTFKEWVKREFTLEQLKNFAKRELPNEAEKLLKAENNTFETADVEDITSVLKEAIREALDEVKEQI